MKGCAAWPARSARRSARRSASTSCWSATRRARPSSTRGVRHRYLGVHELPDLRRGLPVRRDQDGQSLRDRDGRIVSTAAPASRRSSSRSRTPTSTRSIPPRRPRSTPGSPPKRKARGGKGQSREPPPPRPRPPPAKPLRLPSAGPTPRAPSRLAGLMPVGHAQLMAPAPAAMPRSPSEKRGDPGSLEVASRCFWPRPSGRPRPAFCLPRVDRGAGSPVQPGSPSSRVSVVVFATVRPTSRWPSARSSAGSRTGPVPTAPVGPLRPAPAARRRHQDADQGGHRATRSADQGPACSSRPSRSLACPVSSPSP
jgi:hypothetical protein